MLRVVVDVDVRRSRVFAGFCFDHAAAVVVLFRADRVNALED